MSSQYKKRNVYYLSVHYDGKRFSKSLGTKNHRTAKTLKPIIEKSLLLEILNENRVKNIPFPILVENYLTADHGWKKSTLEINRRMLKGYLKQGFPINSTTRAMTIRCINACNKWGYVNKLTPKYNNIPGGNNWNTRNRVISDDELQNLFNNIRPIHFNHFVQFAYFTGVRLSEIRSLKKVQIFNNYIEVLGKSGRRIIKLNNQAKNIIINIDPLWDYSINYVELTYSWSFWFCYV